MKGDDNLSSSLSCIDVQVFENRDDGLSGWNEITKQLPGPAVLKNGVVTFQVTHFSRYVSDFVCLFFAEKLTSPKTIRLVLLGLNVFFLLDNSLLMPSIFHPINYVFNNL